MPPRPPPWTVEELEAGFKVVDASKQTIAYVYGHADAREAETAKGLTLDQGCPLGVSSNGCQRRLTLSTSWPPRSFAAVRRSMQCRSSSTPRLTALSSCRAKTDELARLPSGRYRALRKARQDREGQPRPIYPDARRCLQREDLSQAERSWREATEHGRGISIKVRWYDF